jgi:hypothetical protein
MKPALAIGVCMACFAQAQPALEIPRLKTTIDIGGHPIEIAAWGSVSSMSLDLTVDLGALQEHLTQVLAAELNRSDECGDRITVERASIAPDAPASKLAATIQYERYVCGKAFGKRIVKKLAGGNATVEIKLTPEVAAENSISIDAELVGLGDLGDSIREVISDGVESAIQKSADLKTVLPAALQKAVTIQTVRFADGGAGRLWLTVTGTLQLSREQVRAVVGQ